jgi:hypothetical protein
MAASNSEKTKYPMLEAILLLKNLPLEPMYTVRSFAELFGVSPRAAQNWMASGKVTARNLPGRWRFLAQDVENFLQASSEGGR